MPALRAKLAAAEEALAAAARTREEDLQRTAAFWIAKAEEQQDSADSALTAQALTCLRTTCTFRVTRVNAR